ncbi:MAG: lactate utilization protein [Lachnospiraceae bacterium]|nr:lactate utilization protein [Lachnospiraceae bacterium]
MTPMEQYYETMAASVIKGLEKRQMEGYYFKTAKEAVEKIMSMIPPHSSVSWGGSSTLTETGMMEALQSADLELIDRSGASSPEEKKALERKAFAADYYFMSTNAITADGELVNVDGNGNRVAALVYGPDHVMILAGMNKVAADTAAAITRVHTNAAPPNTIRLNLKTPCSQTGVCKNCLSPDCICSHTVITRFNRIKGRIKVFLIGEELGF